MPFNISRTPPPKADGTPWTDADRKNLLRQDPAPIGSRAGDVDMSLRTYKQNVPVYDHDPANPFQREVAARAAASGDALQPAALPENLRAFIVEHGKVTLRDVLFGVAPRKTESAMDHGSAEHWLDGFVLAGELVREKAVYRLPGAPGEVEDQAANVTAAGAVLTGVDEPMALPDLETAGGRHSIETAGQSEQTEQPKEGENVQGLTPVPTEGNPDKADSRRAGEDPGARLTRVRLDGALGRRFGQEHVFAVSAPAAPATSPATAFSALPSVETADALPPKLLSLLQRQPEGVTVRDTLRARIAGEAAEAAALLDGHAAAGRLVRREEHPEAGGKTVVLFALPPAETHRQ